MDTTPERKFSRKCSYDPIPDLELIKYEDSPAPEWFLPAGYRVHWFNTYCVENNIKGRIDESNVEYDPDTKVYRVTAKVYMNGELAGTGVCGSEFIPHSADNSNLLSTLATKAKGRALANLGFNVVGGYNPNEDGEFSPCDKGIVVKDKEPLPPSSGQSGEFIDVDSDGLPDFDIEPKEKGEPAAPKKKAAADRKAIGADVPEAEIHSSVPVTEAEPEPVPKEQEEPTAEAAAPSAAETESGSMTVEEALEYEIPSGTYRHKALKVLAREKLSGVEYIVNKPSFNDNRFAGLKAAATIVLNGINDGTITEAMLADK